MSNKLIFPSFELLDKPLTKQEIQKQRQFVIKNICVSSKYFNEAREIIEKEGVSMDNKDYYSKIFSIINVWEMDELLFGNFGK